VLSQDSSPFVPNKVITPPAMDGTSAQQLAGRYIPLRSPITYYLIDDVKPLHSG